MCASGPDLSMRFRQIPRFDQPMSVDRCFHRRRVEPTRGFLVSCSRYSLNVRAVRRYPGGIQGQPGNDPGIAGGFVLSSGQDDEKPNRKKGGTPVQSKDRDMGSALRSIYQKTIEEAVPDEMLSLLGKLD